MDTVDRAVGDPGGQVIIDDEVVKLRYIIFILNHKKALSRLKMSNPIKSDAVKKNDLEKSLKPKCFNRTYEYTSHTT